MLSKLFDDTSLSRPLESNLGLESKFIGWIGYGTYTRV
jgi:hypothetical protein